MAGNLKTREMRRILGRRPEYAGVDVFIETGTYRGGTVVPMRYLFRECHSIELSEKYYRRALEIHGRRDIRFHFGHSADVLGDLVGTLDRPAVFFLDAHYAGGDTARSVPEVPLLAELRLLRRRRHRDIIIVDDTGLMGRRVPPFDWSGVTETRVRAALGARRVEEIVSANDRLIIYTRPMI